MQRRMRLISKQNGVKGCRITIYVPAAEMIKPLPVALPQPWRKSCIIINGLKKGQEARRTIQQITVLLRPILDQPPTIGQICCPHTRAMKLPHKKMPWQRLCIIAEYLLRRRIFECMSLASVKIPASITAIGRQAFNYCRALKDVTVEWTTPLLIFSSYEIFLNCPVNEATLHVPTGTKALYERAEVWKDFGTIVEYSPVGNEEKVPEVQPALQAYAANGILYVSGLQYGKPLYIYNIQGQLVYKGVAKAETEQIPLSINEYYIVVSAGQAIKTILK